MKPASRHLPVIVCPLLVAGVMFAGLAPRALGQQPAKALTRDVAVQQALLQNPALATIRKQSGYGEAALIIAKTYPFNPIFTGYVTSANGPVNSGILQHSYNEHYVSLELELRGQGKHRRAAAAATVKRIEWEIANQEIGVSVAVIRAYNAVLYRQQKLAWIDATIKINEQVFEQIRKQAEAGKIKATDLMLARVDLDSARAQRGQAVTVLAVARWDLSRLMGIVDDSYVAVGELDVPLLSADPDALTHLALEQRADLQARRAALCEAEANLRLVVANRYGNLSVGPYVEYDPTNILYLGGRISAPLAVLNTRKGEIHRAETDVTRVRAEIHQIETVATQDVQAALTRYAAASKWAASYQTDVLPNLIKARQEIEKEPNVDLARLLAVQRTYIKANENLLDARFEQSQAQADLAVSVAEPTLAIGPVALPISAPDGQKQSVADVGRAKDR